MHRNKHENWIAKLAMQRFHRARTTEDHCGLCGLNHRCRFSVIQVVNKPDSHGGSLDWTKICEKSSKVITFIDLAGHEKYLKTTVFGMTGHLPDFCMLMVGGRLLV